MCGRMPPTLPTGIDVLDRLLDGGIPAGSIVAFVAAPASQSELLLYELTAARRTLYLSTVRSSAAVADAIERTPTRVGKPNLQTIDADAPIDQVRRLIRTLPERSTVIVDPIDPLEEAATARYRSFLNELQTQMVNTDSIAVLHGLDGRLVEDTRDITEYMADIMFKLETSVEGDRLENRLTVPKFRGGRALDEPIKLELRERVSIDTSRDIA